MTKKLPEHERDARRFRREFIAMMWGAHNSSLEWDEVIALMFEELLFFHGFFEHPGAKPPGHPRARPVGQEPAEKWGIPKMKLPPPNPDA